MRTMILHLLTNMTIAMILASLPALGITTWLWVQLWTERRVRARR